VAEVAQQFLGGCCFFCGGKICWCLEQIPSYGSSCNWRRYRGCLLSQSASHATRTQCWTFSWLMGDLVLVHLLQDSSLGMHGCTALPPRSWPSAFLGWPPAERIRLLMWSTRWTEGSRFFCFFLVRPKSVCNSRGTNEDRLPV